VEASAAAKPRLLSAAIAAVLAAPAAQAATITVNSLADPGTAGDAACTLREAIANANANSDTTSGDCTAGSNPDTIEFDSLVTGTITLNGTQLTISDDLTINGPGAESLSINGDAASRVLYIDPNQTVVIDALTIENGSTAAGGGGYRALVPRSR
jgi:CSLREA domain-containing protein